ncbi:ArsR/SmtB family transcription factor [Amycolatopsis vancoresmycina]|uniref:ArsR family transcriptional regulator n=1 Tax=Amycolatopsis vancoresmycina DSM 44592 TaxID=1292037 RepID=R1GEM9_9PSEU|nr:helix-turn-helix domain-containing protein [Amycolatopsis vancoresmycina]EOD69688.1 ArsR family transcriptional regulator [Amycolatopsis vancoresmycina DSM 44592]
MTSAPPPEELDPDALKAVTHPLRRRILGVLSAGPATATKLAKALGENTGATSYHLRELARFGFVEDAPELARGKERWWRTRPRDIRWPRRSEQSAESRVLFDDMQRQGFEDDLEKLNRFAEQRDGLPGDWPDALLHARGGTWLTAEELKQFWDDYMELFRRYWRAEDDRSPEARRVLVRWLAFPDPGE